MAGSSMQEAGEIPGIGLSSRTGEQYTAVEQFRPAQLIYCSTALFWPEAKMRRGDFETPASRLSAGCSSSELTARGCAPVNAVFHACVTSVRCDTCATPFQWADVGSNHGPSACRADALAAELQAQLRRSTTVLQPKHFFFPVLSCLLSTGKNSRPYLARSVIIGKSARRADRPPNLSVRD